MASSMARGGQSCPGDSLEGLAWFRRELHECLWRRPDSLFELADAVLAAPGPVASLPYLSLEPAFRRGHGMIYQALADGRIDEEALRDLLVAARPRDWPLAFAIDASTCPRPGADCSPDREFHHHSCAGLHSGDGAAIAGWAFQWLAQLSFAHDSWTAPQDQVRVGARDDATRQAAAQVIAHSARLRAAGEDGIPLYVLDAGYDEAPLTWDLRDHLDRVQVLVRFRNDRVRTDGGVSVYDALMQTQADLIGRPVRRLDVTEGSAVGAAFLAGMAAGQWTDSDIGSMAGAGTLFAPAAGDEWRESALARWHDALARARLAPAGGS